MNSVKKQMTLISTDNHMNSTEKEKAYKEAIREINAVLMGESLMITKMSSINCILKQHLPYYFWVGFYCVHRGSLIVGPYQGTLGCIHIPFSKGVCGRAARTATTQIVEDVHKDPEHVACDSRTNSEIVVPVFDAQKRLIAVFDGDSTELASFDEIDKKYLEQIMQYHFTEADLELCYLP
jgi:L-methionine (R)-S-oxide reductase